MDQSKGDAWGDLNSLQDRMNRIFSETLKRLREMADPDAGKRWSPPVDIFELSGAFVLLADLPGISRESVSVEVNGAALIIKGERLPARDVSEGSLYHSERRYGPFERTFNLPINAEPEEIQARMAEGVLSVTIPKPKEETDRVKINIE